MFVDTRMWAPEQPGHRAGGPRRASHATARPGAAAIAELEVLAPRSSPCPPLCIDQLAARGTARCGDRDVRDRPGSPPRRRRGLAAQLGRLLSLQPGFAREFLGLAREIPGEIPMMRSSSSTGNALGDGRAAAARPPGVRVRLVSPSEAAAGTAEPAAVVAPRAAGSARAT